jgi:coiled-coil and C2 domain-containing protein 2A
LQQQTKIADKTKEEEQVEEEYDYLAEVLSEVEKNRSEKQSLLQPNTVIGASLTTTENSVVITVPAEQHQSELNIYTTYPNIPAIQPTLPSPYENGLYVGKKPYVPLSYKNKMGQRVFKESATFNEQASQHWLDLSGDLNNLNEPLKPLFERPSQWFDPNADYLQTNFSSPTTLADSSIAEEKVYQLEIDLISIKFYDHPLFGKEQMLASQMDLLLEEYKERQKLNLATFYSEKLNALEDHLEYLRNNPKEPATARESTQIKKSKYALKRSLSSKELGSTEEDDSQYMEKQNQIRTVIRQTRILRDQEENNDVLIVKKLAAIWEHIKMIRQQQGFAMTTHTLAIKKYKTTAEEDVATLEKQLQSELNELREDHQTRFAQQLDEYRKQVRMVEYSKQLDASQLSPDELPPIPQFKEFDEEAARRSIIERYKQTKRTPGSPILVPVVTYLPAPETAGSFPPLEISRRFEIQKSQLYCKLLVNNRFVTKTKPYTLTPDFVIEVNELFTLQLVKWPDSIKLQVVSMVTGTPFTLSKESVMAEVFLKIPGTFKNLLI